MCKGLRNLCLIQVDCGISGVSEKLTGTPAEMVTGDCYAMKFSWVIEGKLRGVPVILGPWAD